MDYQVSSVEVEGCGEFTLEVREDASVPEGIARVELVNIPEDDVHANHHNQTLALTGLGRQLTELKAGGVVRSIRAIRGAVINTPMMQPFDMGQLRQSSENASATSRRVHRNGLTIDVEFHGRWCVVRRYFDAMPSGIVRISVAPQPQRPVVWVAGIQDEPIFI